MIASVRTSTTTVSPTTGTPTDLPTTRVAREEPICLAGNESFVRFQLEKGFTSSDIALEFRTTVPNGMLAYSPPEAETSDFLSVFLRSGKVGLVPKGRRALPLIFEGGMVNGCAAQVVFAFDTGNGLVSLTSSLAYNDNEWHNVAVSRITVSVGSVTTVVLRLKVGSEDLTTSVLDSSSGGFLDVSEVLFVGGFPPGEALPAVLLAAGASALFEGCVDDVEVDGIQLGLTTDFFSGAVGISSCDTVTFTSAAAYIRHTNVLPTATTESNILFEFITTQATGSLFYLPGAPGTTDFLGVALQNGRLLLQQDLGDGVVSVTTTGSGVPPRSGPASRRRVGGLGRGRCWGTGWKTPVGCELTLRRVGWTAPSTFFNDGEPHLVQVVRNGVQSIMIVDGTIPVVTPTGPSTVRPVGQILW